MKRTFIFLGFAIFISLACAQAAQQASFDVSHLNADSRNAYQKLFRAEVFRIGEVGWLRETSEEELALRVLLVEVYAVDALRSLSEHATPEGRLYGLLGLRIKDVQAFEAELDRYKSQRWPPERVIPSLFRGRAIPEGKVVTQSGCKVLMVEVEKVVSEIESGEYDKKFKEVGLQSAKHHNGMRPTRNTTLVEFLRGLQRAGDDEL